jgi:hypothetical protein
MKRVLPLICALLAALASASPALAASVQTGRKTVTGKITYVDGMTLTIQAGGKPLGVINALTAAANALTKRDYPYVYGGGHPEAGVASIGLRGPGYNGRRVGFDCSGSVAAVLSAAGLWQPGSGVPADDGIITQLMQERLIARGAGKAPNEVTLYDHPGVHIFMNIDGRFFGTSDGGGGGNRKGGAGWLGGSAPDSLNPAFKRFHVLPSVLKDKTSYGHSFTFQTGAHPGIAYGAAPGDTVTITYVENKSGAMTASALQYVGAITTNGTVTALAPGGSSATIQTAGGQTLTFATSTVNDLIDGLQVGDGVQVVYTRAVSGQLVPHAVKITSVPGVAPSNPTAPSTPPA